MITVDELCNWLLENGYADEKRGYGHVAAEDLAEALLNKFTIVAKLYE